MSEIDQRANVGSWERFLPMFFFPFLVFLSSRGVVLVDLATRPKKLMAIAVLLLITSLFLLSKQGIFRLGRLKIPLVLLAFFVGLNAASAQWAFNLGLAVQTSIELLLLFLAILISKLVYNYFGRHAIDGMALALSLISSLFIITSFQEIIFEYSNRSGEETVFINGLAGHRNLLSIYCYFLLVASIGFSMFYKGIERVILQIIIPVALIIIIIFSLVRLVSATSIVAILLLSACYFLLREKRTWNKLALLIPILLMVLGSISFYVIGSTSLKARFTPSKIIKSNSFVERKFWWTQTLEIIDENFWWGCGAGNWKLVVDGLEVDAKDVSRMKKRFRTPHNDYLMIFSETGLPSLLFYWGFWMLFLFGGIRYYSQARGERENAWLIVFLFLSAIGGMIIYSILYAPRVCIDQLMLVAISLIFFLGDENRKQAGLLSKIAAVALVPLLIASIFALNSWKDSQADLKSVLAFTSKGKWDEALEIAKTVETPIFQLMKSDQPVETIICISYTALKDYEKAKASCQRSLEINPFHPKVQAYMGFLHRREKDYSSALAFYREAVKLNPSLELYKMRLAEVLIDCDMISEAQEYLSVGEKFPKLRKVLANRIVRWEKKNARNRLEE